MFELGAITRDFKGVAMGQAQQGTESKFLPPFLSTASWRKGVKQDLVGQQMNRGTGVI